MGAVGHNATQANEGRSDDNGYFTTVNRTGGASRNAWSVALMLLIMATLIIAASWWTDACASMVRWS